MIKYLNGDLLKSGCDIICHQVNCMGVMGAGIALQIRNKWDNVYRQYKEHCKQNNYDDKILLGEILPIETKSGKIIINMFSQSNYGRCGIYTNYDAFRFACIKIKTLYENKNIKNKIKIGFPNKIGCGLAGGSWDIINKIIIEIFNDCDLEVEIWKF